MVRPNILLLLSDEHAFRYLSCLPRERGGEPVRTPALDGLAARGTLFENAYCQMPLCTPSRMCLLTGRDQERCGAWRNAAILAPDIPTLPGHLHERAGYETALVGKAHFGGSLQFHGFRRRPYGDFAGVHAGHQWDPLREWADQDRGDKDKRVRLAGVSTIPESLLQEQIVVRESVALLREHRHRAPGQPWFLCASFSRPHYPWTAPARHFDRYWPRGVTPPRAGATGDAAGHASLNSLPRRSRTAGLSDQDMQRVRAAYMACVDYLDEILGDFLATLQRAGLLEDTIVVYTTDHGEMAGEHGLLYKNTWHEAAIHVPLLVQTPAHRRGALAPSILKTPVSLGDLFPTLCGLAGVEPPHGLDGVDLTAAIQGGAPECTRKPVISQAAPRWRMVRRGRHKYVAFPDAPELLFDLESDPEEQRDLARDPAHADLTAALRAVALDGFDFADVAARSEQETAALRERYPQRIKGLTPNQLLLPDGRLVEGDAALYLSNVLAADAAAAFDDWPAMTGAHTGQPTVAGVPK